MSSSGIKIIGENLFLRKPEKIDFEEFVSKSIGSREFHKELVNPPTDFVSFSTFLKKNELESNKNFLICNVKTDELVGAINLSQIFYGGFKNAYLGYYLFENFAGKGFMTEAVRILLKYYFIDLNLHRIEANIQPDNSSSIKMIKRCGFMKEGFSPKYLKIAGEWRDHERWALIKEDWLKNNKNEQNG